MNRHRSDGGDGEYGGRPDGPSHSRRFLSYSDLEARYGKSRVTIWRWVRLGLLPPPYQLGPNSVAFASDELDARDAGLTRKIYTQEAAV